ncbi:uncharacterized protein LOC120645709 [Panicum virgatum]|uniref:uncharacterized protein LOC120645709 n=1 Tax=Panicum virgatum TaxID=38727 RepID=UPI0019D69526|nr:uncharacterized protein LOC120645709 [Panicum virgatum]
MWVVDMQKALDVADLPATVDKWPRHSIFRVPPRFRSVHGGAVYKPQTVALGPFHHGDPDLAPMEPHKRRAVAHLLRRAGRALGELAAAGDLEDAYEGLGAEWRGEDSRGAFLEMMVADGCFLLEVIRQHSDDYAPCDPVFSRHAAGHIAPFVQRDMLMVENQLPLLLLHTIAAVEGGGAPVSARRAQASSSSSIDSGESSINREVLKFLGVDYAAGLGPRLIGLHPLDLYRRSLLSNLHRDKRKAPYPISSVVGGAQSLLALPRSAHMCHRYAIRRYRYEYEGVCLLLYGASSFVSLMTKLPPLVPLSLGGLIHSQGRNGRRHPSLGPTRARPPRPSRRLRAPGKRAAVQERHIAAYRHVSLYPAVSHTGYGDLFAVSVIRPSSGFLDDVEFDSGKRRLWMPGVAVDESTKYKLHNIMAFEALHGGAASDDVTAFVLFMRDMVDSPGDVALLAREGILWHDLAGGDAAAASLFHGLTRDVPKTGESRLFAVRDAMELYCNDSWRVLVSESWMKFRNTYLTVALTVAIILFVTDIMQTAYAVMSYELTKHRHG